MKEAPFNPNTRQALISVVRQEENKRTTCDPKLKRFSGYDKKVESRSLMF